jgi:hypothetical protein
MEGEWKIGIWLMNRRNDKKNDVLDEVVETEMTNLGVEW